MLTVVWHSITRLYWPATEIRAVDEVLADYGSHSLLARVSMEFGTDTDAPTMPELRTTLWIPATAVRDRLIGTAHHHGVRCGSTRSD